MVVFTTRASFKSLPQECPTRASRKVSHKTVAHDCRTRVPDQSQEYPAGASHKRVQHKCPTRVLQSSVPQECRPKSVIPRHSRECHTKTVMQQSYSRYFTRVSCQKCLTRATPQVCLTQVLLQECHPKSLTKMSPQVRLLLLQESLTKVSKTALLPESVIPRLS